MVRTVTFATLIPIAINRWRRHSIFAINYPIEFNVANRWQITSKSPIDEAFHFCPQNILPEGSEHGIKVQD